LNGEGHVFTDAEGNIEMVQEFLLMRYDLTAPLARLYAERLLAVSSNNRQVAMPLMRRYQFGPVYRFEAKLDPGRYREFWQLDFDTVGTSDIFSDTETCLLLSDALQAVGLQKGDFVISFNNRKILSAFFVSIGLQDEKLEQAILRVLDKSDKIGLDGVRSELGAGRVDAVSGGAVPGLGLDDGSINKIMSFLQSFSGCKKRSEAIAALEKQIGDSPAALEGLEDLQRMSAVFDKVDKEESVFLCEPSLIRGMGYYTGPIFEGRAEFEVQDENGQTRRFGSICGGGRYDSLVENLLGIKVPAVGASIGVDRLAELLSLRNLVSEPDGPVLVVAFDPNLLHYYLDIVAELRQGGVAAEIYCGDKKGLKKQLAYADKRNCPVAIMVGEDEMQKGVVTVRNLKAGKEIAAGMQDRDEWKKAAQQEVKRAELLESIKAIL
jgi:histidyl-tRNA synthetase